MLEEWESETSKEMVMSLELEAVKVRDQCRRPEESYSEPYRRNCSDDGVNDMVMYPRC